MARYYYGHGTAAVFAPLEPLSRPSQVARRLSNAIALGLLPGGTQLPGETDLAATLGVSTVTVREALSVLRHEGLLETRRGRGGGSFVQMSASAPEIMRRHLRELSVVDLRDLSDLYATVSGGAASIAAKRCTPYDLEQIQRAVAEFASASDGGERRLADARLRVLTTVLAQSPQLYRAEVDLQAEFGTLLWLTLDDDEAHDSEVALVKSLLSALEQGDPDAARTAAEQRIREATARLINLRIAEEPA
ncbi:MAG TPA: GntR family transcriptional regulator [Marmoricola sp.]|nr:GntR family transcriptional regulator [Marmoricola sp.]